ncbi:hypothetical protein U1Q18_028318 [Sarracenia purpurea var. burkii]
MQTISSPMLQWLSCAEIPCQVQQLWTETLNCLQRSHPPIIFDSSFLELQAPLLERTLDHPNSIISNPTATFWNSTYAKEKLDYPQNGRIYISKISPQFIGKCHSRITGKNRSSKRVELVGNEVMGVDCNDKKYSCPKRKRRELTEHQKEVRRAQQGREKDCNGHGPGIRTYTALDFSQGNDESQDSQEIRDAESILEMLRRPS